MKMQLVANWRDGWKFYSAWGLAVLIALPELYPALAALMGWTVDVPTAFARLIQITGAITLILRFVKQVKPVYVEPKQVVQPEDHAP